MREFNYSSKDNTAISCTIDAGQAKLHHNVGTEYEMNSLTDEIQTKIIESRYSARELIDVLEALSKTDVSKALSICKNLLLLKLSSDNVS